MSEKFQCGDTTELVGYLYEECEPAARTAIAAHVNVCGACAAELAALRSTRGQLATWSPPDAELGFVIGRREAAVPRVAGPRAAGRVARWISQPLPAWAQVAAAGVVFAIGLSLGIAGGSRDTTPAAVAAATPRASSDAVSATEVTALERRLRDEIAAIRVADRGDAAPTGVPEPQLMARVRALIEESEQRQQRELALRTAEIVRDFDSQRRVDLAQIQRNFGQIEGLTGAEVREQRQMLNYLIQVSQQR